MNIVETKDLTKYYGKARGIKNVNLSIGEGDIFGFIGPNGAGKSTTIRLLLGQIEPSSGVGMVFGLDCKNKKNEILGKIGYMPSEALFYDSMKVSEIIKLSADLRKQNCKDEAKRICNALELDTRKKVKELSLGNRKKLSIVCAMQHRPELYIFDEPTSGLDPLIQKTFFELINERNQEGATVFLSSHVLSEIQRTCNKAGIIREGEIIVCDSVENLSQTSAKEIRIWGTNKIPELKGIKESEIGKNEVSFFYSGEIKQLVSELGNMDFEDISITEPDLNDVFMHFYEKGDK